MLFHVYFLFFYTSIKEGKKRKGKCIIIYLRRRTQCRWRDGGRIPIGSRRRGRRCCRRKSIHRRRTLRKRPLSNQSSIADRNPPAVVLFVCFIIHVERKFKCEEKNDEISNQFRLHNGNEETWIFFKWPSPSIKLCTTQCWSIFIERYPRGWGGGIHLMEEEEEK